MLPCFVFGNFRVHISTGRLVALSDIFVIILSLSQKNTVIILCIFEFHSPLPHAFQILTHCHSNYSNTRIRRQLSVPKRCHLYTQLHGVTYHITNSVYLTETSRKSKRFNLLSELPRGRWLRTAFH